MIHNVTLNDFAKVCKSCTIYIILLVITFIISISISSVFFYFYYYWFKEKNYFSEYINLGAIYVKMLYYSKIDVSEGIGIKKSNKSKECMICLYWYFKNNVTSSVTVTLRIWTLWRSIYRNN